MRFFSSDGVFFEIGGYSVDSLLVVSIITTMPDDKEVL